MSTSRLLTLNRSLLNKDLYTKIHSLWFAHQPLTIKTPTPDSFKNWFFNPDKDAARAFDDKCRALCGPALDSLSSTNVTLEPFSDWPTEHAQSNALAQPFWDEILDGKQHLDSQDETGLNQASRTALAILLLLDQMPRNIFRSAQGVIYSHYDRISQALARRILSTQPRLDLAPWVKDNMAYGTWFYLPLMHSEDLKGDHARLEEIIVKYKGEVEKSGSASEAEIKGVTDFLDFEVKHADILRKFGRYPYRNEALGRKSTLEEDEYNNNGGERFTA